MFDAPNKSRVNIIRPQAGPQEAFLSSNSDIVIYGGAAFGGKTYGLLLEPLRHIQNPDFGAVIFRREATQITSEGGLWDTAMKVYPLCGAKPVMSPRLGMKFPSGMRVTFSHLNQEADVLAWQGSQIALIAFDELTHFEKSQFFYMLSRNRSDSGVRGYMRATTNPDCDSWVAELIAWWIGDDGYPIPSRSGALRWFLRVDDTLHWGDDPRALERECGAEPGDAKSLTFIPASVADNQIGVARDPGYIASLRALPRVERERLLGGNWKVRAVSGGYFPRHAVTVLDDVPTDVVAWARGWDLAATEPSEANPSPDWSAAVLIGRRRSGRIVILHALRMRKGAAEVREAVRNTAAADGRATRIIVPEDPGQAGKEQASSYVLMLPGYAVSRYRQTKAKTARAEPLSAQWQAGNVDVVRGPWLDAFLDEMEAFPDLADRAHDDQVDAAAAAFAELTAQRHYYYADVLREAEDDGRIGQVRATPAIPVQCFWAQRNAATGVWVHQQYGGQHRFLAYVEAANQPLAWYVQRLRDLGYLYGGDYVSERTEDDDQPQMTPRALLSQLGRSPVLIVPEPADVRIGIDLLRDAMPLCVFDAVGCEIGLMHMANYCAEWDHERNAVRNTPRDDGHVLASNGLRLFAQALAAGMGHSGSSRQSYEPEPEPDF